MEREPHHIHWLERGLHLPIRVRVELVPLLGGGVVVGPLRVPVSPRALHPLIGRYFVPPEGFFTRPDSAV